MAMTVFCMRPISLVHLQEVNLRRFIWNDRIHAKAMYRMAVKTFGNDVVPNVFSFDL